MKIERVPVVANPQLHDRLIVEIQKQVASKLTWLAHSFGRVERLVKTINGKKYYTPNIYIEGNEYELIAPDSTLGNFSFFVLHEPQKVEWYAGEQNELTTPFSFIVWVDIRTIADKRNTEAVKREILRVLNGGLFLREGTIKINKIWEKAENVFSGFTFEEIDNQFMMHPYYAYRFEGEMKITDECL